MELIGLVFTALGFIAVLVTLYRERKVKILEFIADYNLQFLTNTEFMAVESMLESCNIEYEKDKIKWDDGGKEAFVAYCDKVFGTEKLQFEEDTNVEEKAKYGPNKCITKYYQSFVNYLVYLESFATLINLRHAKFKEVDDVFAYRFFIAMNNPILQKNELEPYKEYYRGCIMLYSKWLKYRQNKNLLIPMDKLSIKP